MEVDKWTGEETFAIKDVIAMLNEIHQLDPELTANMVLHRFPCNKEIRDHKTVQAHCYGDASIENPKVGLLGILNGLFGIDKNHFGAITAYFEKKDDGSLLGFKLTNTDDITRQLKEGGQDEN